MSLKTFAFAAALTASSISAANSQERRAADSGPATAAPIKHLIIVIGENRTFDHVFGLYKPKPGQTVSNLLSKGIVTEDGKPGPQFGLARQYKAEAQPAISSQPKAKRPTISCRRLSSRAPQISRAPNSRPLSASPMRPKPDLAPADLHLLTTGATGLPKTQGIDTRVPGAEKLPNGPFQLTGPNLPYDSYTGDPVHRFYQMWQQSDCRAAQATPANPSGCLSDLYPYVADTYSAAPKAAPRWHFTMCCKAMRPISRRSLMNTR